MPSRLVTGRDRPEEQLLFLWYVVLGIAGLFRAAPDPGSVELLLPSWEVRLWYVVMLAAGTIGLIGCWWPRRRMIRGLLLEQAAETLAVPACGLYAISLFAAAGMRAMAAGGFLTVLAAVGVVRGIQIHRGIRLLHRLSDGELDLKLREPPP